MSKQDGDPWGPLEARFTKPDGTLDEERFSRFFRDYLMASGRYVPPKDTFPNVEARYEATDFSPKELAVQLTTSSRHYAVICGEAPDQNETVTAALAGLNVLESSTTYPVLLALFQKRASGGLSDDELAHAIQMFRGFILRRFICGESSRGYGQMFVRALAKDEGKPAKALETYLLEYVDGDGAQAIVRRIEPSLEFLKQFGRPDDTVITLDHPLGPVLPIGRKMTRFSMSFGVAGTEDWQGFDAEQLIHEPMLRSTERRRLQETAQCLRNRRVYGKFRLLA